MVGSQTGGDRRAAGGCVALVGIRVGIGASWGRRRVGDRRVVGPQTGGNRRVAGPQTGGK
jgi:hypothetical protein